MPLYSQPVGFVIPLPDSQGPVSPLPLISQLGNPDEKLVVVAADVVLVVMIESVVTALVLVDIGVLTVLALVDIDVVEAGAID